MFQHTVGVLSRPIIPDGVKDLFDMSPNQPRPKRFADPTQ